MRRSTSASEKSGRYQARCPAGRAPQEELHAALQSCLREERQILGPLRGEQAGQ